MKTEAKNMSAWTERIGLQTIIFGENLVDQKLGEEFAQALDRRLRQIKECGFHGVEFFQVPARLGPAAQLEAALARHGLTLLGFSGGSLATRVEYCRGLTTIKPHYLYIQRWDVKSCMEAIHEKHKLALHPHQYSSVDSIDLAIEEIKKAPLAQCLILPDTAHLYLANEDILKVLQLDNLPVQYVHIKDWQPQFGTSVATYARGFCELGFGKVGLEGIWPKLRTWLGGEDARWLIIEQDSTERDPMASCRISMAWLKNETTSSMMDRAISLEHYYYPMPPSSKLPSVSGEPIARVMDLQASIGLDSSRSVDRLYKTILTGFSQIIDCKCATLWEISPRDDVAILRSFWQTPNTAKQSPQIRKLTLRSSLAGMAVDEQAVICFDDVSVAEGVRQFIDRQFISAFALKSMISIPLPNRWNPNQAEILINLFPEVPSQAYVTRTQLTPKFEFALSVLKAQLALAIEQAWEEERGQMAREMNWIAAHTTNVTDLLLEAVQPILNRICCSKVGIYLVHPSDIQLDLINRNKYLGGMFPTPLQKNQELAGKSWQNGEIYNTGTTLPEYSSVADTQLTMPIFKQGRPLGEVIGVIWCKEKKRSVARHELGGEFTVTDELVLDAAQSALAPHLERMLAAELRGKAMARITHELRQPLTIVRHATTAAIREMNANGWKLERDELGKVRRYLSLMEQAAAKAGFLKPMLTVRLDKSRVLLFDDVLRPAIEDLSVYLEERGFNGENINVDGVRKLPAIYVDKVRFQQVAFNILTNAIKYADSDPKRFWVQISAIPATGGINLVFADHGTGIPEGMQESVFREGVRGPNAFMLNAPGDGIGLYMVSEILKAHNATIKVARNRNPTEFTIFLPSELTLGPSPLKTKPLSETNIKHER